MCLEKENFVVFPNRGRKVQFGHDNNMSSDEEDDCPELEPVPEPVLFNMISQEDKEKMNKKVSSINFVPFFHGRPRGGINSTHHQVHQDLLLSNQAIENSEHDSTNILGHG